MKTLRKLAIFPLELVLMGLVLLYVLTECACMAVGLFCRWVEGKKWPPPKFSKVFFQKTPYPKVNQPVF